jgi:hypothetical protein
MIFSSTKCFWFFRQYIRLTHTNNAYSIDFSIPMLFTSYTGDSVFTARVTLLTFSRGASDVNPPLSVRMATVGMASWNPRLVLQCQHWKYNVTHADGDTGIVADS